MEILRIGDIVHGSMLGVGRIDELRFRIAQPPIGDLRRVTAVRQGPGYRDWLDHSCVPRQAVDHDGYNGETDEKPERA